MLNKRIGTYAIQKSSEEVYRTYLPAKLPPNPPIDLAILYPYLEKATLALSELNSMVKSIPNTSSFIYMYVRKEALLSSQIEGTQSSFSDLILFENHQKPNVSPDDVEEVSNYVKAITYGLDRLKNNFPLSLRLLCEVHQILLSGGRGANKRPGEIRNSQNWIGGTRPGNALFVPPAPADLMNCLSNFENFLHEENSKLPLLVKAGIAHVQFETIHPFLDGNGRLGRLLITLLLCSSSILDAPILYLSLYLKQHRDTYYALLQQVRTHGSWETWLEFFLNGVYTSAKQAVQTAKEINVLFANDLVKINTLGRAKFSCIRILEYLQKLPQVSVRLLSQALGMSAPTARHSLEQMLTLGIVEETSGKKRDRIYVYRQYLDILEDGTTPLERQA